MEASQMHEPGTESTDPGSTASSARPSQSKTGPFKCNVCERNYSRIDHLARHFRSHTAEKAHTCTVCWKSFSRSDLLKRHAAGHPDRRRQQKGHLPHPTRVSQACKACAHAKLKCMEEKPCQRCKSKGIRCEYNETENGGNQPVVRPEVMAPSDLPDQSNVPPETMEMDVVQVNGHNGDLDASEGRHNMHVDNQNLEHWASGNAQDVNESVDQGHGETIDASMLLPSDPAAATAIPENLFAGFLRDIMMPPTLEAYDERGYVQVADHSNFPSRDLLSFGLESNLDLTVQDYSLMDFYQGKTVAQHHTQNAFDDSVLHFGFPTPQAESAEQRSPGSVALGTEAFRRSLWCWTPVREDARQAGQPNFTFQSEEASSLMTSFTPSMHVTSETFGSAARDRIFAMILSTCDDRSSFTRVMSSFPSADLLNNLMHCFLASHMAQSDTYIHIPTLKVHRLSPELLGSLVAAGAMLSSSPTIHKLGLAIHESLRLSLPKVCEENNSITRDLGLLQAFVLTLGVGLWSGNKRKMELAESQALIIVTMCRRANRMLRSNYATIKPLPSDTGHILENKWRAWAELESAKRLIFQLFIRDAQTSISLNVPTIISYVEMTLPLPAPKPLFLATTATEWKNLYLSLPPMTPPFDRLPSLPQCLHDLSSLNAVDAHHYLSIPICLTLVAYGIWGLIHEYRNLSSVLHAHPPPHQLHSSSTLVLGHRHQELCGLLQHLSVSLVSVSSQNGVSTSTLQSHLLVSLLLTHLHVSFHDIQVFAGREGEEESRRAYPSLQTWAQSREARVAVWHAGQVIRYAKLLGSVRDFFAVAVYHASLTFWAYGVLRLSSNSMGGASDGDKGTLVWLDGEEGDEVKKFIALGGGVPCFSSSYDLNKLQAAKLCQPWNVMRDIVGVLRGSDKVTNSSREDGETPLSPLVENLSQLIEELGVAASAVLIS